MTQTDNPIGRMNALQMSIDRSNELKSRSEKADNRKKHHDRGLIANKTILAIDPGPELSAIVFWNGITVGSPHIWDNRKLLAVLKCYPVDDRPLVIENIESLGMPVGKTTFETVWWTGRFCQAWLPREFVRMSRREVKMHLCNSMRAKDSNIRQALIDRFGAPGTKKDPGLTYGLKKDLWQAFALAVTYYDNL